jgi:hypothetical protein
LVFITFSLHNRGAADFKALPKSKQCDCVVFERKCPVCTTKSDLMVSIMTRVTQEIEKTPMWRCADRTERFVAEKACERSLVDQIPRDMYDFGFFFCFCFFVLFCFIFVLLYFCFIFVLLYFCFIFVLLYFCFIFVFVFVFVFVFCFLFLFRFVSFFPSF